MKIGPLDNKPVATATTTERKSASPPAAGSTEASAKVQLSPAAAVLAKLSADPAFDTAKVDRIAQAIRDGKFEVNPDAIADKLIENAKELLSRKPSQ
jgi:negative regulator of flagellin synthesis FlgM